MVTKPQIAVIGGGVNGLSSAYAILRSFPDVQVSVLSEHFSPYTTSDGAGGIWGPFETPGTSEEDMNKWSQATWDLLDTWWKEGRKEVLLIPVQTVNREEMSTPFWSHIPFHYRELSQPELKSFGPDYVAGHTYKAYVAETSLFLPKLMEEITKLGGSFQRRNVRNISDLGSQVDIIVNCSGIGSRYLVPDESVYPIRGQVMRVRCPRINFGINDESEESFSYIFPNTTSVVVGGTHQENDWRTSIDEEDSKRIWQNATKIVPQLKGSEIIREWAGLRPARRGGIRIEEDEVAEGISSTIPVIHNYGHGGSGITTFWGCAQEVSSMVGRILHKKFGFPQSKF